MSPEEPYLVDGIDVVILDLFSHIEPVYTIESPEITDSIVKLSSSDISVNSLYPPIEENTCIFLDDCDGACSKYTSIASFETHFQPIKLCSYGLSISLEKTFNSFVFRLCMIVKSVVEPSPTVSLYE